MLKYKITHIFILVFPFLIFTLKPYNVKAVDILYTGSTNGQIENCRCPSDPYGSMEKRAPEINRRRALGEVIVLDSGDFMPESVDTLKARTIIEIMAHTRYDAIALGDQELQQGIALVAEMSRKLPLVSANLEYADGRLLAPSFRVFDRDSHTYIVTAIYDPMLFLGLDSTIQKHFKVHDPDEALNKVRQKAPRDAVFIVLCHAPEQKQQQFASSWQGMDLIIGGHTEAVIEGVDHRATIPIVQAGAKGRYLGVAQIHGDRVKAELVAIRPEFPDDSTIIDLFMKYKSEKKKLEHKEKLEIGSQTQ